MKLSRTALLLLVSCGVAAGQTPDLPNRVRSLLANGTAQPQTAPASQAVDTNWSRTAAGSSITARPLTAPATKITPDHRGMKPEPAITVANPGDAVPARNRVSAGRRDPFLSPVVDRPGGSACAGGKRCLVIDQMVLRGIVRTPNGMIAVVANSANKAYFLKEKDPVFNGVVLKITGDSVVFREHTVDNIGRTGTREVVKKVSPTPSA